MSPVDWTKLYKCGHCGEKFLYVEVKNHRCFNPYPSVVTNDDIIYPMESNGHIHYADPNSDNHSYDQNFEDENPYNYEALCAEEPAVEKEQLDSTQLPVIDSTGLVSKFNSPKKS
ncbi:hypothetical protein TKK_0011766 [Trichogramma kaykai]